MTLDSNEPERLYLSTQDERASTPSLLRRQKLEKRKDKARQKEMLEARKTMIDSQFWDKFVLLAKVCYMRDKEADLYDVFETYRTKVMGGWENTPEQLEKIDRMIEKEDLKNGFARA